MHGASTWTSLHRVGIIPCRFAGLPGVLSSAGCRWDWLEATTGPVMLFHAVQAYKAVYPKAPGLNILKPGLIYPIDWRRTVWGPNDGPGAESFRLQKNMH